MNKNLHNDFYKNNFLFLMLVTLKGGFTEVSSLFFLKSMF